MPILTALPGTRPSLRSFSMDEWPQGGAKMRGGRGMRWAQVSAPAGARMELAWENINYAQAELISAAWDAGYGTYGNLQLASETLAGLVTGLADLIEQPFPDAIWRCEGPPVVEAVKAGRCTVRLLLRTRRDLRPDAILPGPATPLTTPFIAVPASVIRTRALAPEVVGTLIGTSIEVPALEAITVSLLAPEVVGSAFFPRSVDVPVITVTATVLAPEVVGSVVPSSVDVPVITVTATVLAPEVVGDVTPWTPAEITTALWLKADDASTITESGGDVSQWNDKSGNGRNFTATGATQPTYTAAGLNGKAVLDFADDYLTSASANSTWTFMHDTTGSSVFVVVKAGINANPDARFAAIGNNGGDPTLSTRGIFIGYDDRASESASDRYFSYVSSGSVPPVRNEQNDAWPPNEYQVIGVITIPDGVAADRQLAQFNGGNAIANNTSASFHNDNNSQNALQVGAGGANTFPLTGGIAEVVIVSGIISEANRERMEGYLAHEWGRTSLLPGDHPYKTVAPTV